MLVSRDTAPTIIMRRTVKVGQCFTGVTSDGKLMTNRYANFGSYIEKDDDDDDVMEKCISLNLDTRKVATSLGHQRVALIGSWTADINLLRSYQEVNSKEFLSLAHGDVITLPATSREKMKMFGVLTAAREFGKKLPHIRAIGLSDGAPNVVSLPPVEDLLKVGSFSIRAEVI